jgi:hypothetical protein
MDFLFHHSIMWIVCRKLELWSHLQSLYHVTIQKFLNMKDKVTILESNPNFQCYHFSSSEVLCSNIHKKRLDLTFHFNINSRVQCNTQFYSALVSVFQIMLQCLGSQPARKRNKWKRLQEQVANWLTAWLTPWRRAPPEKPPVVQLLKNFPTLYGTRRFSTVFTRALHWSLSWARSI